MTPDKDIYKAEPRATGASTRVLILTADKTEDLELFYPYYRFLEEGFSVDVATPNGGKVEGKQGLSLKETRKITDVKAQDYDLLFIPGGKAPEALKKNTDAVSIVQDFARSDKPVTAICHGPQLLAAADVIRHLRIAAWPECQAEVEAAGATFTNQETVQDGLFVTARMPADLPAFTHAVLQIAAHRTGKQGARKAA